MVVALTMVLSVAAASWHLWLRTQDWVWPEESGQRKNIYRVDSQNSGGKTARRSSNHERKWIKSHAAAGFFPIRFLIFHQSLHSDHNCWRRWSSCQPQNCWHCLLWYRLSCFVLFSCEKKSSFIIYFLFFFLPSSLDLRGIRNFRGAARDVQLGWYIRSVVHPAQQYDSPRNYQKWRHRMFTFLRSWFLGYSADPGLSMEVDRWFWEREGLDYQGYCLDRLMSVCGLSGHVFVKAWGLAMGSG